MVVVETSMLAETAGESERDSTNTFFNRFSDPKLSKQVQVQKLTLLRYYLRKGFCYSKEHFFLYTVSLDCHCRKALGVDDLHLRSHKATWVYINVHEHWDQCHGR